MTEIVAAHLERFIKIARQVAHDYDVWCEHIDDPDIEKLEEMLAAALAACAREEHKATCIICSVKREPCPRLAALERAVGEKAK